MANNQLLASDNFASGSLAAGWSALHGLSASKVVAGSPNVTEPNAINTTAGQIWTGLTWPSDHTSEVILGSGWTNTSNNFVSLQVRMSAAALSGYQVNIAGGAGSTATATIYSLANGAASQLVQSTGLSTAPGDIWAFQVLGPCLVVSQNFKVVAFWVDVTYTSGSPGFSQVAVTAITQNQVSSWNGYNSVQQDGIWQKQGSAKIPLVATDINTGSSNVNSGIDSATQILHEGNAQILSGTVYKMWFGTASGIQYAESTDCVNWSRYGSTLIAGYTFPQVIKNGNTYYLYVQSNTLSPGQGNITLYTSTDGINWSQISTTCLALGSAGTWDHLSIYLFSPVAIIGGTWYALYSGTGTNAGGAFAMGLATSSDGVTWTKYASNPVAQNVWASVPYLINGTYYLWPALVPPGQESPALNPSPGGRIQSTDLINWTHRIPSIHNAELAEGVNSLPGFAYPTALVTVGGQTYMYYEAGPSNTISSTGSSWNLALAIAPAPMSSVVLFPEDGLQQTQSDAFTSGTGNLDANWTTPSWGSACKIVAGPYVEPTATGTVCAALFTGASFGNDQYSQATIQTLTASNPFSVLSVRGSTTARTQYEALVVGPTGTLQSTKTYITKTVAGSTVFSSPFASITPQVGDVWTLSVVGNVISLFQNDYLILQMEDVSSTPITSGIPGFWLFNSTAIGDTQISSWAGGNANVIPNYPPTSSASSSWLTIAIDNSLRGLKH